MNGNVKNKLITILLISLATFAYANILHCENITIVYTAQTHGMIDQCDCPNSPDGGIFRRATLIKDINTEMYGRTIVLDGGGTFAGGLEDQYTMGDELDKERTLLNLRGMVKMGYDAICVGEDEFIFGINFLNTIRADTHIPFLSCNIFYKDTGKLFTEPYIIKKIGKFSVGIIGVTTQDLMQGEYANKVENLLVEDPITQVEKMVKILKGDVDIIILLSHLGDDKTKELVRKVKGIDIALNAHRWKKSDFAEKVGGTLVTQFNYQGKKIARIDFDPDEKKKIGTSNVREVEVSYKIDGDPELTQMVTDFRENIDLIKKKKVRLDLYVMSHCPYGSRAENLIFPILDKFKDKVDLNLYFIVSKKDDKYVSLHGPDELDEDLRQISVKSLKPEKVNQYITCVNGSKDTEGWKDCLKQIGIDEKAVNDYLSSGKALQELNNHFERKQRLRVDASPTLYINNRKYNGGFANEIPFSKAVCDELPESKELIVCQELPECLTDNDCWKDGYIGKCKDSGTKYGKCLSEKDVEFTFTVLTSKDAIMTNEVDIINSTKSIFPAMKLKIVDISTDEGQMLKNSFKITKLPAYIFDEAVKDAHNFKNVKGSFVKEEKGYVISPDAVGASLDISKKRIPGKILLFYAPLSDEGNEGVVKVIEKIRNKPKGTLDPEFHYLVFKDEDGNIVSRRGVGEIEESIRQLVVKKYYPERFYDYIIERAKNVGSSYWEDAALAVKLDPYEIKKIARSKEGQELLKNDVALVTDLQIGGDIIFFINNQEIVYVRSSEELDVLLNKLGFK
jgi:hypothetical protein